MTTVHAALGIALLALFAATTVLGSLRWWQAEPSEWFWRLLRGGQLLLVAQVLLGAGLLAAGHKIDRPLHLLYGLLPVVVSFVAEQLRIAAAETVLEARGLPDAAAVGGLDEAAQRSVVLAIVRRELGVMTLAALTIVGLLLRAGFV